MLDHKTPLIAYGWLRALLAFIFFLVLYIVVSGGVVLIFRYLNGGVMPATNSSTGLFTGVMLINSCFLLSTYLFRRYVDRKTFGSLGFPWQGGNASNGALGALFVIGGGTFLLWALGYLHFTGAQFNAGSLLFNIVVFAAVAVGEELFFRGYVLNNLMQSFNKWPALFIASVFFMSVHLQNPGATVTLLPVLSVLTGGVLFGINYIYTRSLWFGIFLHFTWNFLQGPVFSYQVTGERSAGIFIHRLSGPPLITGGVFGFEGSIICIALSVIATVALFFRYNKTAAPGEDTKIS